MKWLRADRQRIVITGLGAVSAYGAGLGHLLRGLKNEGSAIRFQPGLDKDLPCRIGASAPELLPGGDETFPAVTRAARMALMAASEAWEQAGLQAGKDNADLKIHASVGWGPYDFAELRVLLREEGGLEEQFTRRTGCGHGEDVLRYCFRPALGVSSYLSACAASTQALGRAWQDLQSGRCGVCLAGGADSRLHIPGIIGYDKLGALAVGFEREPGRACRPFDAGRRGFVIGEGAGFVVMETLERARARGAEVLAEVHSAATTTDAYRLTDPHPDGEGAALCIRQALERAGMKAEALDYIQAHGTGTPANDRAEAASIKRALGEKAGRIPLSSLKPYFGHLSMAAGALEVVASVLVLKKQFLPVCLNLEEPEEGLELNYVRESLPIRELRTVLKNSFGFGGQNACLILGAYP